MYLPYNCRHIKQWMDGLYSISLSSKKRCACVVNSIYLQACKLEIKPCKIIMLFIAHMGNEKPPHPHQSHLMISVNVLINTVCFRLSVSSRKINAHAQYYIVFHTMDESTGRVSHHEDESRRRAKEVLEKNGDSLLDKHPDITAMDVGYKRKDGIEQHDGEVCLIICVRKKLPECLVAPDRLLPKEIDGVDVDVVEGVVYYNI